MIQVLTYLGNEEKLKGNNVIINKLHDAQSLDEFDINIINLQHPNIWFSKETDRNSVNAINDFNSLSVMIQNSKKSNIIILLPQNTIYSYNTWRHDSRDWNKCELKDMISGLKVILGHLYEPIKRRDIVYENTKTQIGNKELDATFYFNDSTNEVLTKSVKSEKSTAIKCQDVILSTLKIDDYESLMTFLKAIKLIADKQEVPKWIKELKMFDDDEQMDIIIKNEEAVRVANENISEAQKVLNKNNEYKSILYTSGDELVEVVFEILQEMLECDLSEFKDKKKEDFKFRICDKVFVGEIKGVTPNVKKLNVSQLDNHVQEYLDEYSEETENVVALLVINHQRNKPISDREPVHIDTVKVAERNGSLIVETISLLKLFEQYLAGEKTREECIELLVSNKGLLII